MSKYGKSHLLKLSCMHYLINGQLCEKTKVQQGQEKDLFSLWVMDKNGHLKMNPHNLEV